MVELITHSKPVYSLGTILAQIVEFDGLKNIGKVSLNLSVVSSDQKDKITGVEGVLSFQAANFQESRKSWAFQPTPHWSDITWQTSGTAIKNTGQVESYGNSTNAALNAPYIKYELFLDKQGNYDLWGYGYTSGEGAFWSWNDDTSDLRRFTLGDPSGPPEWTKFGTIYSEEGGACSFSIYLSDAAIVVLDQWYFTQDLEFNPSATSPISPLSESPFNTCVRIRSLNGGSLDSLTSPSVGSQSFSVWMPSKLLTTSGKYNYLLQNDSENNIVYSDGLSLEFWQIGGSSGHFAAWDFIFPESSSGESLISTDFGQTFTELS